MEESSRIYAIDKKLKKTFQSIKEEFDEHLTAINENTEELAQHSELYNEVDNRMIKLEEKMEELHFMFKQIINQKPITLTLSKDEQKVFLVLYTHEKEMTAEEVGLKCHKPKERVEEIFLSLTDKGLPLVLIGQGYLLRQDFRLRQAKENIITIDEDVVQRYQNSLLHQFFE